MPSTIKGDETAVFAEEGKQFAGIWQEEKRAPDGYYLCGIKWTEQMDSQITWIGMDGF